jgi:hypothetical protein
MHTTQVQLELSQQQDSKIKRYNKTASQDDPKRSLGLGVVSDASFMGQPNEGSQFGYCILLGSTQLYDGEAKTHMLDWSSSKIHRKVKSTLAAEAAGASRGYDRATFCRALIYEIEHGRGQPKLDPDTGKLAKVPWTEAVTKIPCCVATDCRSLYDLCNKQGSLPDERRVALDLLDVREGLEHFGDKVRWVPTEHMLSDSLTKRMLCPLFMKYFKDNIYSFKYSNAITPFKADSKRERSKVRKAKIQANKDAQVGPKIVTPKPVESKVPSWIQAKIDEKKRKDEAIDDDMYDDTDRKQTSVKTGKHRKTK